MENECAKTLSDLSDKATIIINIYIIDKEAKLDFFIIIKINKDAIKYNLKA